VDKFMVHGKKREEREELIIIKIIIRNGAKRGSKEVGVTIESYGKVEISYINVDNF
jgi:hypothetical protein